MWVCTLLDNHTLDATALGSFRLLLSYITNEGVVYNPESQTSFFLLVVLPIVYKRITTTTHHIAKCIGRR